MKLYYHAKLPQSQKTETAFTICYSFSEGLEDVKRWNKELLFCEIIFNFLYDKYRYIFSGQASIIYFIKTSKFFNTHTCPHWISRNLSIAVQLFWPQHWFPQPVPSLSLCSSHYFPVFTHLSNLGSSYLPLCPPLSSKKNCWFFSVFSFLLVRTDFWAPDMENWIPELLSRNFESERFWTCRHQEQLRLGVKHPTDTRFSKPLCPHFPSWLPEFWRLDIYSHLGYCKNPEEMDDSKRRWESN